MAKVKIEYVHHVGEHKPGEAATVEEADAVRLVTAGVAKYVEEPASAPKSK